MDTTTCPAMEAALRQIQANSDEAMARKAKIDADSRIIYLRRIIDENTRPITGFGRTGFDQMMDNATSARGAMLVRAGYLLQARRNQLSGYRTPRRLADAAFWRCQQMARTRIEAMYGEAA